MSDILRTYTEVPNLNTSLLGMDALRERAEVFGRASQTAIEVIGIGRPRIDWRTLKFTEMPSPFGSGVAWRWEAIERGSEEAQVAGEPGTFMSPDEWDRSR